MGGEVAGGEKQGVWQEREGSEMREDRHEGRVLGEGVCPVECTIHQYTNRFGSRQTAVSHSALQHFPRVPVRVWPPAAEQAATLLS